MTGIIILAAGESSRLGQPKQNLVFSGKTLLQHAISTVIDSGCKPIIVMLGANYDVILPTIQSTDVKIIHNPDWREGMASSIRKGITALQSTPGIDSTIIMLCDQPFVYVGLLNRMLAEYAAGNQDIVACTYNEAIGVPVLFNQKYFPELLALRGNEGAKKLLAAYADQVARVPFPKGAIDIDTQTDYQNLVT